MPALAVGVAGDRGPDGLAEPSDLAEVIAALATMTSMLPQLLGQLARWLKHAQQTNRLRVDDLTPLPDPDQMVRTLTTSLQHSSQALHVAAAELDTAHQHAAHLAAAPTPAARGQKSCRSEGPNHLTRLTGDPAVSRWASDDQNGSVERF